MPRTLYLYILKDVLKLLVIATVVLVIVISFAVSIKPLTEGLLTAETLLAFVVITSPTMLVYALPFSTAFAVSLVYTRMATEGEITACSAGGMSYRTVLMPVVLVGVLMMAALFGLSNWVLPSLNRAAKQMIQKDILRSMMAQFAQGRAVKAGDTVIYARQAHRAPPIEVPGSPIQPVELIMLRGATMGKLDPKSGRVLTDHTASEADLLVFRDEGRIWIQPRLKNPIYHVEREDAATGVGIQADRMEMLPTIELVTPLMESARFMSWAELMAAVNDPDSHSKIQEFRRNLAAALAVAEIRRLASEELATAVLRYGEATPDRPAQGALVLSGLREGEEFFLSPPQFKESGGVIHLSSLPGKPVRIDYVEKGELRRRYEAVGAVTIEAELLEGEPEPRIVLNMKDVSIADPRRAVRPTEHTDLKLTRLRWREPLMARYARMDSRELLALAEKMSALSAPVREAAAFLRSESKKVVQRAVVEFHLRAASALALLLGALFAAVLSIRLRGSLSLVVFFWTFLVVLLVTLLTQQGARYSGSDRLLLPLAMLWLGSLVLAGIVGMNYARVARN